MVKLLVAAALFAASTEAVQLNGIVYNQYEAETESPKEDRLAEFEEDEEAEDQRTFGGDDEELSQLVGQSLVQIDSEKKTTPLATPQNPLYSNELPFKAISRDRVAYDRSQAYGYHDKNLGYVNSQHDGSWKGALAQTTPLATPQNPLYSNELPFKAISRDRVAYDRSQAYGYHDKNLGYVNSQHDGMWKGSLAQQETTPLATPQNPLYSNELPFKAISRDRVAYDRSQAYGYHDKNLGYVNSQHDGSWKGDGSLAQKETTPLATPQNPLYSNELPFKAISRDRVHYDRSQAYGYHDKNLGYVNSQHDGSWKGAGSLAETTPLATPQNPLYSNELPFKAISRDRVAYDRSQAYGYHDKNLGYVNSQHDGQWKGAGSLAQTTPLATPQNPLYSNELPFKAISRDRVAYDRSQAYGYHDKNLGYVNSQHDGMWKV